MGILKWAAIPAALLLEACTTPADTLYIDRAMEKAPGTYSDKTRAVYATNVSKDEKGMDSASRGMLGGLEGLPFDLEFMEYKDDGKVKEFRAALKGNPEPLYAALNLIKSDGDFLKWYLARLENDGLVAYHKAYKGIRNRKTSAKADTGVIYMLELANGSSVVLLTDEKDAETLKQRGIENYVLLSEIAKITPKGAAGKIKAASGDKEKAHAVLEEISDDAKLGYEVMKSQVLSVPGYGWPVTEDHLKAAEKLSKLDEQGKIRHFKPFKLVNTPEGKKYYDFAIIGADGTIVLADESKVPELAADPEGFIKNAKKFQKK